MKGGMGWRPPWASAPCSPRRWRRRGGFVPPAATTEAAPPAKCQVHGHARVVGLGVDLQAADGRAGAQPGAPVAEEAEKALGFKLEFTVKTTTEMEQIALTQPESFDIFSGYHPVRPPLALGKPPAGRDREDHPVGGHQQRVQAGKVDSGPRRPAPSGQGDAPVTKLYRRPDKTGAWATSSETNTRTRDHRSGPTSRPSGRGRLGAGVLHRRSHCYNMDSMGYNADVIQKEPNEVSWPAPQPEPQGRVALPRRPVDRAPGRRQRGTRRGPADSFGSLGNMTKEEMDLMFKILTDNKSQFKGVLGDFNESVNFMASGRS
jgi:hypothetical protein